MPGENPARKQMDTIPDLPIGKLQPEKKRGSESGTFVVTKPVRQQISGLYQAVTPAKE
jgi:hypothetical protein